MTIQDKLAFLARFKDACLPDDVIPDRNYPEALHVILSRSLDLCTDKVIWSGSVRYLRGDIQPATSPDAAFLWAAVSFIQRTTHGDQQRDQILFPGSWAVQVYGKWLVLWFQGINVIQTAHTRYGLRQHRLVNRERGLLLAEHENLDETIGLLPCYMKFIQN